MSDPQKTYRLFLKLYPARFREEYEAALEQQFRDDYRETHGAWAHFRFWIRTLADLAVSAPVELAHEVKQDLGYAFRAYRRRAFVTFLALSSLAVAIGAATGMFSVLNAVLLRSLPFRDPDRLVQVENYWPLDLRHNHAAFEDVGFYSNLNEMNLSITQGSARIKVAETSANFFALLGTEPQFGRGFAPGEDIAGRDSVAIIGHGLWQQLFGGNPRVLGSTVRLNGFPLTVVGVAPPGFDYPGKTLLWTPTAFHPYWLQKEGAVLRFSIGRLKTGFNVAQATQITQAEMMHTASSRPRMGQRYEVRLVTLRDTLAGPVRKASLVLMGIAIFVLMIASANIAHLLLSRTTERRQELALRASLGASRARIVQQLITESTLLTLAASAPGLVLAHWVAQLATTVVPAQLSSQQYSILDWRVFGFAAATALVTGLIFGVIPVSLIGRMQPGGDSLRVQMGQGRSGVHRMRSGLVTMQSALTVVLLAGAVVMGQSFLKLMNAHLGFHTGNVVTLNVSLSGTTHEAEKSRREYYGEALYRLRAIPGIQAASMVGFLPLGRNTVYGITGFKLETGPEHGALFNYAGPDYFRTMATAVIAGREFTAADRSGTAPVIIVNDTFARQTGEKSTLIGKKLKMSGSDDWRTIVGVVGMARFSFGLGGKMLDPQVYLPMEQQYTPMTATFVARVRQNPQAYIPICRAALQSIDPQVPVYDVMTYDARLNQVLAKTRFYTISILFLGGFSLLLAVVGSFGVASYSVSQRTHEIGVRMAVGASTRGLRCMLLRQNIIPVVTGVIAGIGGAFGLSRFLQHLMVEAEAVNASTCGAAALVLVAAAVIAVWTASGRILQIGPMDVLRAE